MIGIIDTHAHIVGDTLFGQIDEVMKQAQQHNIIRILCICLSEEQLQRGLEVQAKYSNIDLAIGFHPTDLNTITQKDWEMLETYASDDRIVAIGEIGLDYYWKEVDPKLQKEALIKQIELAKKVDKPILIHMREATKDILEILESYNQLKGIIHCYSGSIETANRLLKLGFHISVGGPLTFKNARGLPEVIAQLPINRLFVETDSPYLTPHPFRGKENRPHYVQYTFEKMCEIKGIDASTLMQTQYREYMYLMHGIEV